MYPPSKERVIYCCVQYRYMIKDNLQYSLITTILYKGCVLTIPVFPSQIENGSIIITVSPLGEYIFCCDGTVPPRTGHWEPASATRRRNPSRTQGPDTLTDFVILILIQYMNPHILFYLANHCCVTSNPRDL